MNTGSLLRLSASFVNGQSDYFDSSLVLVLQNDNITVFVFVNWQISSPKWCIQLHWKLYDANLSARSSFIRMSIRIESREKRLSSRTAEPCVNPRYKLVIRWNFWHELRSSPCKAFITTSSCFFLASRSVLIDSRIAVLKISTCSARHKHYTPTLT